MSSYDLVAIAHGTDLPRDPTQLISQILAMYSLFVRHPRSVQCLKRLCFFIKSSRTFTALLSLSAVGALFFAIFRTC